MQFYLAFARFFSFSGGYRVDHEKRREESRSVDRSVGRSVPVRPRSQVLGRKLAGVSVRDREGGARTLAHTDTRADGTHARCTHVCTYARSSPPVWKSPLGPTLFVPAACLQHAHTPARRGGTSSLVTHTYTTPIYLPILFSLCFIRCLSYTRSIYLFHSLSFSFFSHQPLPRLSRDRSLPFSRSLSFSLSLPLSGPLSRDPLRTGRAQPVGLYMSSIAREPSSSFPPSLSLFLSLFFLSQYISLFLFLFLSLSLSSPLWPPLRLRFTLLLQLPLLAAARVASDSHVLGFHSDRSIDDDDNDDKTGTVSLSFSSIPLADICTNAWLPGGPSLCDRLQPGVFQALPSPLDSSPEGVPAGSPFNQLWTDVRSCFSSPLLTHIGWSTPAWTTHRLVYVDGFFLAAEENITPPARRTADRPVRQARSIAIASRELLPRVARGSAQRRFGNLRHLSVIPVAFTLNRLVPEQRRGPEPFVSVRSNRREWKFPAEHS